MADRRDDFVRVLRANCGNILKYETYSPAGVKPLPGCIVV